MRFPDAFLQEIKFRNDIEEIVSRYVPLKAAGANMVACCPFHSEKTPSFTVSKSKKFFHCFGCNLGGDVITFVMLAENIDYVSAITKLADWARIPLPAADDDKEYRQKAINEKRLYELNREAALFFHKNLTDSENAESKSALEYIQKRGIRNPTIKHFGLGYALNSWDSLTNYLSGLGYSKEELQSASLAGINKNGGYYDFFKGRLMFPIIDVNGHVIAFSGRIVADNGDDRKYLNSSDKVYKKSRHLYALNFAKNVIGSNKRFDYFIMCEGNIDVVSMHQAGFTNSVASLGTAVTPDQARLMVKYAKKTVLAYDSDEAGKKAMQKAAELLGEVGIEVKVLSLGDAKDPDEFIQKYGKEKLENQLVRPKGYIDNRLDMIYEKYNIDDTEEKVRAISESCEELSRINSEVERELYGSKLADRYRISRESVLKDIRRIASSRLKKEKADRINEDLRKSEGFGDRINPDRVKTPEAVKKEEVILGILLNWPELYGEVKNILDEKNLIKSDFNKKIFELFKNAFETNGYFDTFMTDPDLKPEEQGAVSRMRMLEGVPDKSMKSNLDSYINSLEAQYEVYEKRDAKKISASDMSVEDMAKIFAQKGIKQKEKEEKLKKGDNENI